MSSLRLLQGLGLGLDEGAQEAAERWSFEVPKSDTGSTPVSTSINFDFLLPEKQSRWHLTRVAFQTPEGALSPHFVRVQYPAGDGISPAAFDDARLWHLWGGKQWLRFRLRLT